MTVEQMRRRLIQAYPGPKWTLKCQDMPERQVIALYKNLKKSGRLDKRKKQKKNEPGVIMAVQITMLDLDPTLFDSAG